MRMLFKAVSKSGLLGPPGGEQAQRVEQARHNLTVELVRLRHARAGQETAPVRDGWPMREGSMPR